MTKSDEIEMFDKFQKDGDKVESKKKNAKKKAVKVLSGIDDHIERKRLKEEFNY